MVPVPSRRSPGPSRASCSTCACGPPKGCRRWLLARPAARRQLCAAGLYLRSGGADATGDHQCGRCPSAYRAVRRGPWPDAAQDLAVRPAGRRAWRGWSPAGLGDPRERCATWLLQPRDRLSNRRRHSRRLPQVPALLLGARVQVRALRCLVSSASATVKSSAKAAAQASRDLGDVSFVGRVIACQAGPHSATIAFFADLPQPGHHRPIARPWRKCRQSRRDRASPASSLRSTTRRKR